MSFDMTAKERKQDFICNSEKKEIYIKHEIYFLLECFEHYYRYLRVFHIIRMSKYNQKVMFNSIFIKTVLSDFYL